MKERFFDFEVTPNWWECTFGDMPEGELTEDIKDTFITVTSDDINCRDKLISLMKEPDTCVLGYNIKGYDLMIANAIYQGFTPQQVKIVNDLIINPVCAWDTKEHIRLQPFAKKRLTGVVYQDLLDDNDGTLKEKEAILGLDIRESTVDFNKENLTSEDKADMTYYNKHDVYSSMVYYRANITTYTETKLMIGKLFNIPEATCRCATNAKLVGLALKAHRTSFADSTKVEIKLPEKIAAYCRDNLPANVLNHLLNSQEALTVNMFNNIVDFGNGGLHSIRENDIYVESNDEWVLLNADAQSYYPSIMIQFNLLSRAIGDKQGFIDIFNKRLALKAKEQLTIEEDMIQAALKLILNTTYGASGNKYLDIYDPYMTTSVCRVGQLFLAALANRLYHNVPGIEIIQTNTDGILLYVRRSKLDFVKHYLQEWETVSGISTEIDFIDKIWQRDVNNYLLVKENGKVKNKGSWLSDTSFAKGVVKLKPKTAFVCAKAAQQFLLNGIDPIQSIVKNKCLDDFIITCKKGPSYFGVVQRYSNGLEVPLFKCNRVIATKDEQYGRIYKMKHYKGNISYTQMPSTPEHCLLMNNALTTYSDDTFKQLDYMYYIERTFDLLAINWHKLTDGHLQIDNSFNLSTYQ